MILRILRTLSLTVMLGATSLPAHAQQKYDPGVSATEIKIGTVVPYSGPLAIFGTWGRLDHAYWTMVNERGGINGRKVTLTSLDDAYSPPKTVEQVRKLVEEENVFAIIGLNGTSPNLAVYKYLNSKKVPHLLIPGGIVKWDEVEDAPWSTSFSLGMKVEGMGIAQYLLQSKPNAKIGLLYQNDDVGKEFMRGFREALGDKADSMITKETSYNVTDTTVDSQVTSLQGSGADTFVIVAVGKFPSQAIRKAFDSGWKPLTIVWGSGSGIKSVLEPVGLDRATGLLTTAWLKNPADPRWKDDKGVKDYLAFMKKYLPDLDPNDILPLFRYNADQLAELLLKNCGNELTRENLLHQATSLKDVKLDLVLPGLNLTSSPTAKNPVKQLQMSRFDGKSWVNFGDVIKVDAKKK